MISGSFSGKADMPFYLCVGDLFFLFVIHFYTFLLIFPNTANFIGFLSPQEPLIGLGVLLVAISIKLFENYKNYSFAYGLILGLGVSVKFTFILLFIPLSSCDIGKYVWPTKLEFKCVIFEPVCIII